MENFARFFRNVFSTASAASPSYIFQEFIGNDRNLLYFLNSLPLVRFGLRYCTKAPSDNLKMKVLNVAEKNDAAKNIATILSSGRFTRREGLSTYNKIYQFEYMLFGNTCSMVMTSVSGHLLSMDFVGTYRKWDGCNPVTLFEAPVIKMCPPGYEKIKKTLEREIHSCGVLVIWTDCDREGENIGSEVMEVCLAVRRNIRVYRAKFSEITPQSITRAARNLAQLDNRIIDAVDVRQELDLRIGAAFTRFQTMRFQNVFPEVLADSLISYGSCQFPTLGFVVERFKEIEAFISEPFWKILVKHLQDDIKVEFNWKRGRLFDQLCCRVLFERCLENPRATVVDVKSVPKSKWRPLPLDTVEFEKICSRKLHINAKEAMKTAEKLYTKGFISYPRTETNVFPKELDLRQLVEIQTQSHQWGGFASRVLLDGPNPRQGKKSDQAHPPIHPTKYTDSLQGNEKRVYEYIVRHFLACLSHDAQAFLTTVEIDIAEEKFVATGLMIVAKNYLEVYIYEKWNDKAIPAYNVGQTFSPTKLEMTDGATTPPPLLSEADLIALMEKHGIGTDATHAEHIEKIKERVYVLLENNRFKPGELGMGLVEGYDAMGFEMSKPHLRAGLEADLKHICDGTKNPKVVLREQINIYKNVFVKTIAEVNKIDEALGRNLRQRPRGYIPPDVMPEVQSTFTKCPKCNMDMTLRKRKDGATYYIGCMGYPRCKMAIWFPQSVKTVTMTDAMCTFCQPHQVPKLKFVFHRNSIAPLYGEEYIGCIGGCDQNFLEMLGINRTIFH